MIGRLSGTLLDKQAPLVLIECGGVGYEVTVPMTTYFRLPEPQHPAVLFTHLAVSETAQQLYGFANERDRDLYRQLIKVNGVGPKMAVGILSMESDDFVRCIREDNLTALTKVPGVGKKTAERLLIEMRDRLADWQVESGAVATETTVTKAPKNDIVAEAESALIALGYKPTEASRAIAAVADDSIARSEELIRLALRNMLPS